MIMVDGSTLEAGADALQKVARLLEMYPDQFAVEFYYNGRIPAQHVIEVPSGDADIYILSQGRRLCPPARANSFPVAQIDLGTGQVSYPESPYRGFDLSNGRRVYLREPDRSSRVSRDALRAYEKAWNDGLQKARNILDTLSRASA